MRYLVYSTEACPKCEQLKRALAERGLKFESVEMGTPEALTELRVNGVFTLAAPVLQARNRFYTVEELFQGDRLRDLDPILSP
jgi:glutaredoxin